MQSMILTTKTMFLLYFFLCHITYLSWKSSISSSCSNSSQLTYEDSCYYRQKYKCTIYINFFEACFDACNYEAALRKK